MRRLIVARSSLFAVASIAATFVVWPHASAQPDISANAPAALQLAQRVAAPAAAVVNPRPNPQLSDFVLYAQRTIALTADERIDGNVGVHAAALNIAGSQLSVGGGTQITHLLVAPSVNLASGVTFGGVLANQLVQAGSSAPAQPFPAAGMPPLPFLRVPPAAGTQPVNVPAGGALTLGPGNYGALTAGLGSVLRLQPGNYIFSQVTLAPSVRVLADVGAAPNQATVVIRVLGKFTALANAVIRPIDPNNASATARHLIVYVYGTDDRTDRGVGQTEASAYIGIRSNVTALLAAPHGTLLIDNQVRATGAFSGYDITVKESAVIGFQDGFPDAWAAQGGSQKLQGYLPTNPDAWPVMGPVPLATQMTLSISLPVRSPPGFPTLKDFVKQVSDPKQPATFRQFLTQAQFKARYGATDADYVALRGWAISNGFATKSFSNNLLLSITGTAGQFEQALNVLLLFRQRSDGSLFVSLDRNPSLTLSLPILDIAGLTSFLPPRHNAVTVSGTGGGGSGFPRSYRAADLRTAYLGDTSSTCRSLTGVGQVVGLVEFDVPSMLDVQLYDALNNISSLSQPTIAATEGGNPPSDAQFEATLDVVMVQAMAPLAQILVFQGSTGITFHLDAIYNTMATWDPALTVVSSSLSVKPSAGVQQALDQMASHGVSFFQASGDFGDIGDPEDSTRLDSQTLVGGTMLSTNPLIPGMSPPYPSPYFMGETTWNRGSPQTKDASGGGIMNGIVQKGVCFFCAGQVDIPDYQIATQQANAAANQGSQTVRNYPDVAMVAESIEIFDGGVTVIAAGTSAAAPLWAGFTALANQKRASLTGQTTMGFLNKTLYDIGQTRGTADDLYASTFNDIKDNSNNSNGYGGGFPAVAGYDLATGWGSPTCNLLNQLASPAPLTDTTPLVELEFIIGTGDDNLEPYSELEVAILLPDGVTSFTFPLHPQNAGEWQSWDANNGGGPRTISSIKVPVPPSPQITRQSMIRSVTLTLVQHYTPPLQSPDNWDITSLTVNAYTGNSQRVCQIHLAGSSTLDDGHPGLFRFKQNVDPDCTPNNVKLCGPSGTFSGGCP
jgi:hypothetical protein